MAAVVVAAVLPAGVQGEEEQTPLPKAGIQARIAALKARATTWLKAREQLVDSVGLVSRERFWHLQHAMRSPAFRASKDAQKRVTRDYDRFGKGFPKRRRGHQIVALQFVDDTHAVVWNTWVKGRSGTTERMRTAWLWASERGAGQWFLWGAEDGTWPVHAPNAPVSPLGGTVDPDPPAPRDADTDLNAKLRSQTLEAFRLLEVAPTSTTLVLRYVLKPGQTRDAAIRHVETDAVALFRLLQTLPPPLTHIRVEWLTLWRDAYGKVARMPRWTSSLTTQILTRVVWENLTPEERVGMLTWKKQTYPGWIEWPRQPTADASGSATPTGAAPPTGPKESPPKLKLKAPVARSLAAALRWLAAHQSPDGRWEAAGFEQWCDQKPQAGDATDGHGKSKYDTGVTGLAARAFLAAGYKPGGTHANAEALGRALHYMRGIQDEQGCFGSRTAPNYIYNHATCALAMIEAYGASGGAVLRQSAQRALDFIAAARNPSWAWRYGVRPGDNDTSVSGWMALALHRAAQVNEQMRRSGAARRLGIDKRASLGVEAWLSRMTEPRTGRVGYITRGSGPARPQELIDRFPGERSEAMTAVAVLIRAWGADTPLALGHVRRGVALISALPPRWNPTSGSIDMYYWYYATLAMREVGGRAWSAWKRALTGTVVSGQRRDGTPCSVQGSWDPIGPWGPDGGRVYATAILAISLANCATK